MPGPRLGAAGGIAACTSFYEIPIETPIQPKMDVSMFQRVLIAGFIGGGTEDVDANLETVRLLRSQLRTKSSLRVIEAEVMQLADIAKERAKGGESSAPATPGGAADGPQAAAQEPDPTRIRNEKDLERYQSIFADVAFWKQKGEEYQGPLIITGTVLFSPLSTAGYVPVEREVLRPAWTPARDSAARLPGAQGLHPAAEVDLHRRPHRRDALLRDPARRDPLQRAAEYACALVRTSS